jgi:hypothetical protein
MKTIGKRIQWMKYMFLILLLGMTGVDIWLFCSLSVSEKNDSLLWIMSFVVLAIVIIIFLFTLLSFLKKKEAILIDGDRLIIREYKETALNFKDIKSIQYRQSSSPRTIGNYKSGNIIITLQDEKKITISSIADVRMVCKNLREIILKED